VSDKVEALGVAEAELAKRRTLGYAELASRIAPPGTFRKKFGFIEIRDHEWPDNENYAVTGPSGTEWHLQVEIFWDDKPGGDIRVAAAVCGGPISCSFPKSTDFIIGPDGSFVGE
jgi:hypothetical protein